MVIGTDFKPLLPCNQPHTACLYLLSVSDRQSWVDSRPVIAAGDTDKNSHMSFYTCFNWFKKLRLFVNEWNLKIDVVLKALCAVVIRWFSNCHFLLNYNTRFPENQSESRTIQIIKDWSKFLFGSWRNNLNQTNNREKNWPRVWTYFSFRKIKEGPAT
jgi:hypothetical protein